MLLVAGAAVLMTALTLAPIDWLHAAVLPLALLAPGHALLIAILGPRARLDAPPALALSLMLTLTIYALLTAALYACSIPISRGSVLTGVDALIVLLLAVAVGRSWALPAVEWPVPAPDIPEHRPLLGRVFPAAAPTANLPRWRGGWGTVYLATAVLSGLVLFVVSGYLPKPVDPPFSQFYLAGRWAHTGSIVHVARGHSLEVFVGITNQTHGTQLYRITPQVDEAARWPVHEVRLGAGRRWRGTVRGTIPADGCLHRLSVTLHLGNDSGAVGSLVLWVRGPSSAATSCAGPHA
jgi:uncharacterized membrane protein